MFKYLIVLFALMTVPTFASWDSGDVCTTSVRWEYDITNGPECFIDVYYLENAVMYKYIFKADSNELVNPNFSSLKVLGKTVHKYKLEGLRWAGVTWKKQS
jgi:hypothetical protein